MCVLLEQKVSDRLANCLPETESSTPSRGACHDAWEFKKGGDLNYSVSAVSGTYLLREVLNKLPQLWLIVIIPYIIIFYYIVDE